MARWRVPTRRPGRCMVRSWAKQSALSPPPLRHPRRPQGGCGRTTRMDRQRWAAGGDDAGVPWPVEAPDPEARSNLQLMKSDDACMWANRWDEPTRMGGDEPRGQSGPEGRCTGTSHSCCRFNQSQGERAIQDPQNRWCIRLHLRRLRRPLVFALLQPASSASRHCRSAPRPSTSSSL